MFVKIDGRPSKGADTLQCPECGSQRLEVRIDTNQSTLSIMCRPCLYLYMDADYTVKHDRTQACKV